MNLMRSYDRIKAVIGGLLLSDGLRAKAMRGGAWLGVEASLSRPVGLPAI